MHWFNSLLLYLFAGGIVNFLFHLCSYISSKHEYKTRFTKKADNIWWKMFYLCVIILTVWSAVLVIPAVCHLLDCVSVGRIIEENENREIYFKRKMSRRCQDCVEVGMPLPVEPWESVE